MIGNGVSASSLPAAAAAALAAAATAAAAATTAVADYSGCMGCSSTHEFEFSLVWVSCLLATSAASRFFFQLPCCCHARLQRSDLQCIAAGMRSRHALPARLHDGGARDRPVDGAEQEAVSLLLRTGAREATDVFAGPAALYHVGRHAARARAAPSASAFAQSPSSSPHADSRLRQRYVEGSVGHGAEELPRRMAAPLPAAAERR